ncbi:MAG: hypothetical protein E7159_01420 [Firmicutes bacterium]|nr:hypothetical protein [Bacillota bacterium]
MKKNYLLLLLLILIPFTVKAEASMTVTCDQTNVDPNATVTCEAKVFDRIVSGGEGTIVVDNGTLKSITPLFCAVGEAEGDHFACIDEIVSTTATIVRFEVQTASSGSTTISINNAKVVGGDDFDTIDVNVTPLTINTRSYVLTLNNQGATTPGTTSVNAYFNSAISTITVPKKVYTLTYNYNGNGQSNTTATSTFTFGGYYSATSGAGTQYITANGTSAKNYDLHEDKTLYAKWTGGNVTLPNPTRTGYTLTGWYDADVNGTKINNGGSTYTPNANKTLYAHWDGNKYTITLNSQNASTAGTQTIYEKYGTGFYLDSDLTKPINSTNLITKPAKSYTVTLNYNGNGASDSTLTSNYTFNGYYTNETVNNQIIDANGKIVSTNNTLFDADTTLSAKWTAGSVTLPNPTREDYVFTGWFSAPTNGTKIGNASTEYTPSANKTLYAQWKEILKSESYEVKQKKVIVKPAEKEYKQSELESNVETANDMEIYDHDNKKISNTDPVGTGYKIKTSNVYYDIVVLGDITGDGLVQIGDVSALYNHYRGKKTLKGVYLEAGLLTGNDEVMIGDVSRLYNFYKGNRSL